MDKKGVRKVTLSIPDEMVVDIDYIARYLGLSRSAFVTAVLGSEIRDMAGICAAHASNAAKADVTPSRYSDGTGDAIDMVVRQLKAKLKKELQGELFSE